MDSRGAALLQMEQLRRDEEKSAKTRWQFDLAEWFYKLKIAPNIKNTLVCQFSFPLSPNFTKSSSQGETMQREIAYSEAFLK